MVLMSEPADVASQPAGSGPSYHVGRNQRVDLLKIVVAQLYLKHVI